MVFFAFYQSPWISHTFGDHGLMGIMGNIVQLEMGIHKHKNIYNAFSFSFFFGESVTILLGWERTQEGGDTRLN